MVASKRKFQTVEINSFSEFLTEIKNADEIIKTKNNAEYLVFRGQPVNKDLFPKIGRPEYLRNSILDVEKSIFNEFRRLSIPHLDMKSLSNWETLAMAQHHFLPTRLLDWTENPLTALWFAFNEKGSLETERVVWCFGFNKEDILDQLNQDCFSHKKTIVYQPNHITRRIINQTGWFTSHFYSAANNKYSALNNLKKHWNHLYRIVFKNNSEDFRDSILSELNTFGVNYYSIFPDLEGLSLFLDWKTFKRN